MYPLRKKQTPFQWKTSNGDKVLVWNGEHYMLGNVLGLVPNQELEYITDNKRNKNLTQEQNCLKRITDYLNGLSEDGYPYDFIPVMLSGLVTDNAPPNPEIIPWINHLNKILDETVHIEMIGLSDFFENVRTNCPNIPVYSGDWPDWWADGVGSTPAATNYFAKLKGHTKQY